MTTGAGEPAVTERVPGGWRVKTQDGHHLEVRPMRLARLVEVPVEDPRDVARFWCYSSVEAAVLAAEIWHVSADSEPLGWLRSGGARRP